MRTIRVTYTNAMTATAGLEITAEAFIEGTDAEAEGREVATIIASLERGMLDQLREDAE